MFEAWSPAAMEPPVSMTAPDPAVAVMVPPPQEPVSPFGLAIVSPAGSVSTNPTPVRGTALADGFVIVKLNALFVFGGTTVGLKSFAIDGGATTPILADAVPPMPP